MSYPKMPVAVLAWLQKKEQEAQLACDAGRALHAYVGEPDGYYEPIKKPVVREIVWECKL